MTPQQQAFLQHIGTLIPKLFEAIRLGNVKSECVLGDRIIGQRQVRLKLVAEVVDPGSNPLATHSQMRQRQEQAGKATQASQADATCRSNQIRPAVQSAPSDPTDSADQSKPSKPVNTADQSDAANQPTRSNQDKPTPPRRGPRRNHPMSR